MRDWVYDAHRRIIAPPDQSPYLCKVLRGLRKRAPSGQAAPRPPIMHHHLLAVRGLLNLRNDARHRAFFTVAVTCWQGVKRCGDLLRPKAEAPRPWDPSRCLHRGRVSVVAGRDVFGRTRGRTLIIDNKPSKVNPTGEKEDLSYYPVDRSPGALTAAVLIQDMLRLDPRPGPPEQVPLFVDPGTGCEITYRALSSFLDYWLRHAGYPERATGTHALRILGRLAWPTCALTAPFFPA